MILSSAVSKNFIIGVQRFHEPLPEQVVRVLKFQKFLHICCRYVSCILEYGGSGWIRPRDNRIASSHNLKLIIDRKQR